MAITSATTRQLSDGNSQGTQLGISATDLISFYAATPQAQKTSAAQAAIAATSVSGATNNGGAVTIWAFTSQAQANSVVTLANELRLALVNLGLIKGS